MKHKKTIERELKTLAKSLREREGRVIGYSDRSLEKLPLLDQLDFLNQFVRDANIYTKRSGKVRFNYARDIAVFTTLPEIRRKLLEVGYPVMRNKHDEFAAIEGGCCAKSRRYGTTYTNLLFAGAVADTGLGNAKLGRTANFNGSYISTLLHCRTSPICEGLEWTVGTKRICTFLGYSPEELFPTALWAPIKKYALCEYRERVAANHLHYGSTAARITDRERKALINVVFKSLTPHQRTILSYRFGLYGHPWLDTKEVAKLYGVTVGRIMQIEARALQRLRHPTRVRILGDLRADEDSLVEKAGDPFRPTGKADNWGHLAEYLAVDETERDALPLSVNLVHYWRWIIRSKE